MHMLPRRAAAYPSSLLNEAGQAATLNNLLAVLEMISRSLLLLAARKTCLSCMLTWLIVKGHATVSVGQTGGHALACLSAVAMCSMCCMAYCAVVDSVPPTACAVNGACHANMHLECGLVQWLRDAVCVCSVGGRGRGGVDAEGDVVCCGMSGLTAVRKLWC